MIGETIAALSTPFGEGAIAVIRITGERACPVAAALTGQPIEQWPPRMMKRAPLQVDGRVLDDLLVVRFAAPASYTGEDLVELHLHGGVLLAQTALQAALSAGATPAEPGEFTQRAFLNGKMDLTQAEAVMDLIQARGAAALQAAHDQLEGGLGHRITELRDQLLEALAHIEAFIDFPEEDIDPETGEHLQKRLGMVLTGCQALAATSDEGRILREGARIVISGKPNVGKSSLLNRLLGQDRAIVAEIPGTTRDSIEESVSFHGIPVRFIDTAGLRETFDPVEKAGVDRSLAHVERADIILQMESAEEPPAPTIDDPRVIRVMNKADLAAAPSWGGLEALPISCRTGDGLEELRQAIHDRVVGNHRFLERPTAAVNARHRDCLQKTIASLEQGIVSLKDGLSPEFISIELREALDYLGEIVGKIDTEQLLDRIFANFCIGK